MVSLVAGVACIVPMVALGYEIQTTLVPLGSTAAGQLATVGLGYWYPRYRHLTVPIRTPSGSALGYATVGTVDVLAVAVGLPLLLAVLNLLPGSVIGDVAATDPTFLLGLAVLPVVVVAPVEEFLFRGVIQRRLRDRFGATPGDFFPVRRVGRTDGRRSADRERRGRSRSRIVPVHGGRRVRDRTGGHTRAVRT